MSYLVDISENYYNRKAYANQNIYSTKDDAYAYVNSKGVIKQYDEMADYTATYGKNGCGSSKITVTSQLSNLSLPIGKDMYSGQTCGNENTYVAYDFPARKSDVSNTWLTGTTQRAAGTLPYSSLLSDMTTVGKAGYIDMDTRFHSITPTFLDTYGSATSSYITGTASNMTSCKASSTSMKYGEKITLLYGTGYLQKNTSDNLVIGTTPTEMYILPSSSLQTLGSDVKYGDSVYLSVTESITTCGTSCNIGGVTYSNEFKLGDSLYKNAMKITSANTVDTTGSAAIVAGTSIKYTEPIYLDAIVYTHRMVEGDILDNHSNGLKSKTENSNTAYLTYESGKIKVKINSGTSTTLNSDAPSIVGGSMIFKGGKIQIRNESGTDMNTPYPSGTITFSGNTPYQLYLSSSGLVVVVDANNSIQWRSDTTLTADTAYNGYLVYGKIADSKLSFGTSASTASTSVFKFSKLAYGTSNTCDVESLKKQCVDVSGCAGIIHSSTDSTWMKMMTTNLSTDYEVSKVNDTNVYLRNMKPGVKDKSCPDKTTFTYLSASDISGYPVGKDIRNDGQFQCNVVNSVLNLAEYDDNVKESKQHVYDFDTSDISLKINGLEKYYASIQDKSDKYDTAYTLFTSTEDDNVKTGDQQLKDSNVVLSQEKTIAMIWGLVSISMLLIILFRPRLNTT